LTRAKRRLDFICPVSNVYILWGPTVLDCMSNTMGVL